jgi:Putative Actinobacterial Holin-X, holin superfamily III
MLQTDNPDQIDDDPPGIKALLGQLASDTTDFARAELAFLRAEAGERAGYALPGLVLIGLGLTLAFGTIVALLIGTMLWLMPILGGWAIFIVGGSGVILAGLACHFGTDRLRRAVKTKEDR